jgi:transcriptional regulator with XRE-family HTH domain
VRQFPELLRLHLCRAGLSQAEFARRVGLSPAQVSHVAGGHGATYWRRGELWADVLGLSGEPREEFLLSLETAAAPPRVRARLLHLERKVKRGQHPKN